MVNSKINFVFGNLNQRGGGERLTLVTMKATQNIGVRSFDLTTLYRPNLSELYKSFGKLASVMKLLRRIYLISILDYLDKSNIPSTLNPKQEPVTINTHGDVIPYYNNGMTKDNCIVYCHFPTARNLIQSKDIEYLQNGLNVKASRSIQDHTDYLKLSNEKSGNSIDVIFKTLNRAYTNMINNSTVLTNSEFSRKAILSVYRPSHIQVLYPPVEVELFRKRGLDSGERKDIILVISRIDPAKEIEKALSLAKALKKRNVGTRMIIVGSLAQRHSRYFRFLQQTIRAWDIKEFVTLKPNAPLEELLGIIGRAKIYFHPKYGEHFGISIAEAMAAGLIPIVPNSGGQTEFVPSKFQYSSTAQAADLVSTYLITSNSVRRQLSDSVSRFSTSNYMKKFQMLLAEKLH